MINDVLRNTVWELFPEVMFYDEPVSDEAICGLALINDEGPNWIVAYDRDRVLELLSEYFYGYNQNESDLEALEWYHYNVLGSYIGQTTPLFIENFYPDLLEFEFAAQRFYHDYESYIKLDNITSLAKAYEIVTSQDTFLYVPLERIEDIQKWL